MGNFDFLNLPLNVQDIITENLLHSSPIQDCLEFSKTSEYCLWLIQRVKAKKIIKGAIISCSSTNLSFYLEGRYSGGQNPPLYFPFDYSQKSANDLNKLLSFINFRTLMIGEELFSPKNVEFFKKFENSWAASVKNVKKLHIYNMKNHEEEFLKFVSLIETLEKLEIYEVIKTQEFVLQILSKMKNVKSLNLTGKMSDEFLKLLASKTSPEKPLVKCRIHASPSTFTVDAQEKFKQDVYCVKKDEIQFDNQGEHSLIVNWKIF